MTDPEDFARRLVAARSAKGWSQQVLADASAVAAAQISRYESGRSNPRPALVARLSNALEVPFEWLLEGRGQQVPMFEDMGEGAVATPTPMILRVAVSRELFERLESAAKAAGHSIASEVRDRLTHSLDEVPHTVDLNLVGPIKQVKRDGTSVEMTLEDLGEYLAGITAREEKRKNPPPQKWAAAFPNAAIAADPEDDRLAAALAKQRAVMASLLDTQREANVAVLESQVLGVLSQVTALHNPLSDALLDLDEAHQVGDTMGIEKHAGRVGKIQQQLKALDELSDRLKMQIGQLKEAGG